MFKYQLNRQNKTKNYQRIQKQIRVVAFTFDRCSHSSTDYRGVQWWWWSLSMDYISITFLLVREATSVPELIDLWVS